METGEVFMGGGGSGGEEEGEEKGEDDEDAQVCACTRQGWVVCRPGA